MEFKSSYKFFFSLLIVSGLSLGWLTFVLAQGPISTALPTPTPSGGTIASPTVSQETASNSLPDLIVEKIEADPARLLVGESTPISVTIKNIGTASLTQGNNFNVDLYIDPPIPPVVNYHQIISPALNLPWGAQWFFVPPGESHTFTTTWVFTDVETYEIWAQVDSDGNVSEENEDNNLKQVNVSILTDQFFHHATHQDFMTNMASTLDNADATGRLTLGRFVEPPFFNRPFANAMCQITSEMTINDYNVETPDTRINVETTGRQVNPYLVAGGNGVVISIWEDARNGEILDRDIFLRYSTNGGLTWGGEIRVNDDPAGANQLNPAAAMSDNGHLLVVWQDFRSGNYDIYAQQFQLNGPTLSRVGDNVLVASDSVGEEQINPNIAVDETGGFHVVWQDKRNGNYDIFATSFISTTGTFVWQNVRRINDEPRLSQQVNPSIDVVDWLQVSDIEFTIGPAPDYEVTVDRVISESVKILSVVWEDYRQENADIAITISQDGGETFGFDDFINSDADPKDTPDPTAPAQLDPDVVLSKDKVIAMVPVQLPNGQVAEVEVEVPATSIHVAWQDFRNSAAGQTEPDIFYSRSLLGVTQQNNTFAPELTIGDNEQINQNDERAWQTSPVEQREPALAAVPCGGDADEAAWNIFITWADGRNYDSTNYDIFYAIRSDCGATFENNEMLADGVRLYNFDTSNPSYDNYDPGYPPPGRQVNPGVATDIELEGSTVFGGYLYLAWEDDRGGDPQVEKDIFFARSNLTFANQETIFGDGAGSYISNILDSATYDTTWYTVSWSGATDDFTYITVQTRLGNSISEVLSGDWYPQRFPIQPQPGSCDNVFNDALGSGAPLQGYDAPGQHIEDAAGDFLPQARYIQYRVNFYTRASDRTPELTDLTIYYKIGEAFAYDTFLPLILKQIK
jgi:hypothetical protein